MTTAAKEEISIRESANRLRVLLPHAYNLVWAGVLRARKVGKVWKVDAQSVSERLARLNRGK
jgi:excisionase family DNA binding protein